MLTVLNVCVFCVYTILGGRIIFFLNVHIDNSGFKVYVKHDVVPMVQNLSNLAMHIAAVLEYMVLFLCFLDNGFLFLFFYFGM